jgi:hypothetical protein
MSLLVDPQYSFIPFETLRSGDFLGLTDVPTRGVDGRQVNPLPEAVFDSLARLQKLLLNSNRFGAFVNTEGLPQYAV